jgi:hypothetical protein
MGTPFCIQFVFWQPIDKPRAKISSSDRIDFLMQIGKTRKNPASLVRLAFPTQYRIPFK